MKKYFQELWSDSKAREIATKEQKDDNTDEQITLKEIQEALIAKNAKS